MMNDGPELAPKPEWLASFNGISVRYDPNLSPGWIKFLDGDGNVIGMIYGAKAVHIFAPSTR